MRLLFIDWARGYKSKKRGGGQIHLSLESPPQLAAGFGPDLLAIDDALNRLAVLDDRKAKVFELRFYARLTADEIATALKISIETAGRDWKFSRACLRNDLATGDRHGS
jgi:DNA-directed RNA polymerase specialized sigma24 family protein